jgi:type IV secretion system protein VirB9
MPAEQHFDTDEALRKLREQYPNLNIPSAAEVQWVTPTGEGAEADIQRAIENNSVIYSPNRYQVAGFEFDDDDFYDDPIAAQLERDIRDAQRAQHWMDIREDLALREIDNKALALVREFATANNAVPPIQGQRGVVSYNYGDHIPKLVCRPNRVTNINLQPGEKVTAVHAGDTTRWQILPAKSGTGDSEVVHVVIKPLAPDISTNLLIMTDRRTYNLDLVSSNNDFIPSIQFNYPEDTLRSWDAFIAQNRAKRQDELVLAQGANLSPDNLYFGYVIGKSSAPWKPVRVFDDGTKTYIEMTAKYQSLEAPVLLFYEGKQQKMVNYRVKDRFYIVDRIMTRRAVLIAGQNRVIIERKSERRNDV